eukprot:11095022-Karenia_brevis.AAC.1
MEERRVGTRFLGARGEVGSLCGTMSLRMNMKLMIVILSLFMLVTLMMLMLTTTNSSEYHDGGC